MKSSVPRSHHLRNWKIIQIQLKMECWWPVVWNSKQTKWLKWRTRKRWIGTSWRGRQNKCQLSLEYKRLRVAIAVMSLITIRRVMNSLLLNCRNVMNRSLRSPWFHSHGLFPLSISWVDLFVLQGVVVEISGEQKRIRETIQPEGRNRKWPPNYDLGDRGSRWQKELV